MMFAMSTLPTVRITDDSGDGFRLINEDAFDPNEHERYEAGTPDPTDGAKSLAEEEDIDLSEVEGSGKKGRVTKADVDALVEDED